MPHRIMKLAPLLPLLVAAVLVKSASAEPPCFANACETTLTATSTPETWTVKGRVGEKFLLYLNIYEGRARLPYKLLPGGCAAAYSSPDVAAVLHACGKTSALRYVALDGRRKLRVVYRYEPR